MRIAVISDIHGNKDALKAVLEDLKSRNIDTTVCTGDLVGYLPFPSEVIGLLRKHKVMVLKGNHDEVIAMDGKLSQESFHALSNEEIIASSSRAYTRFILTEEEINYLDELPEQLVMDFGKRSIRFVHGSARNIKEYMYNEEAILMTLINSFNEDIIVSGHTHIPYYKVIRDKYFINAGSVGKPKHGNSKAVYVILEISNEDFNYEKIEVNYDLSDIKAAIKNNPYISDKLVEMLEKGQ